MFVRWPSLSLTSGVTQSKANGFASSSSLSIKPFEIAYQKPRRPSRLTRPQLLTETACLCPYRLQSASVIFPNNCSQLRICSHILLPGRGGGEIDIFQNAFRTFVPFLADSHIFHEAGGNKWFWALKMVPTTSSNSLQRLETWALIYTKILFFTQCCHSRQISSAWPNFGCWKSQRVVMCSVT